MSQPIPHIGRTLAQIDKRAVRRRFEHNLRQLHAEEEAAAFRPLPEQFIAANDSAPAPVPTWRELLAVFATDMLWTALAIIGWIAAALLAYPVAALLVHTLQAWPK